MPTAKPRHMLTEDDQLARSLAVAAQRWPDERDRPTLLLRRLIEAGSDVLADEAEQERAMVDQLAGSLSGIYGRNERNQLRDEWPA